MLYIITATECTEANMVYVQHITKQQPTCQVPIPPTDDDVRSWPPVDGCECVPPYIMDEALNQCVLPEDCGCRLEEEPGYIPVRIDNTSM